ncbi:MAG TPA: TonB-dependent receptor [Acidisarcina sp.]
MGLCFLLVQQRSFAQVDEGSIDGTVRDTSGAVVPNAKVTLLNTDVGLTLDTNTTGGGEYSFSPVRIGHYKVSATAPGFSTTTQENIELSVQQRLKVDIELKAGAASQTVEVTTAPPLLQTEEGSVGQVVDQRSINNLPLNGRNFTFLAQLGAGVNTPQADTRGNAASGAFSANGLRPAQNNYLLDGIDNNSDTVDFLNGTNFVILPPIEAIQEFKVQTAAFSAELGRSAGAVLNGTIKSGTNSLHGAVWEFFRNDKLDAADWFEDHAHIQKGALRQNQFGGAVGGPIIRNKIFFFADYEGLRRVQGTVSTASVPTLAERTSGFTDLSDRLGGSSRVDLLKRNIPSGTVLDPATTRAVTAGAVDPVSGLVATGTGYVRDPFGTCSPSTLTFTSACGLNQLPVGRIDPNAVKLLDLFPAPNAGSGLSNNYANSPKLFEHRNAMDSRLDFNFSDKDQVFARYSLADDPLFIPGPFGGIADGGAFQQGNQTALAQQSALAYTHLFSPSTVNVARIGFNHLHTTRLGPLGLATTDYPSQYGIQGIPQGNENGGLPTLGIGGLSNLGSSAFLPSDETSQTLQVTDDFTKVYGQHSFKMGFEVQHVVFTTLQPGWSRGQFNFDGNFTDIPTQNNSTTGEAQLLLTPTLSSVPGGVNDLGGADGVYASNINKTDDAKNYLAGYFQDDWKVNPKLTLNLGVRYDYFGLIYEQNGAQANFVPGGPPTGQPMYLLPSGNPAVANLSTSFTSLLAKDGIALKIGGYGKGLGEPQKYNISPRFGFAYQASDKLVVRGGFGLFYNAFENQGYGPNIGENYPFVFNFSYFSPSGDATPIGPGTPWQGCTTAGPGGTATIESGLSCISLSPASVNAKGLGLEGLQFNYKTPYTESANFTLQYSITPTMSVQAAYVLTLGRHLQAGIGNNNLTAIYPVDLPGGTDNLRPFPDFGHGASYQATVGSSNYNGLQTKVEKQFSGGLSFLATYTWSKALSDAGDLLNGGSTGGGRASAVPGLGIGADYGLADFDIEHVVHLSGNYELPFGNHKRFLGNAHGLTEAALGGWSMNWIATLQGGQPITINCPTGTSSAGCFALKVPGQSQKLGIHIDAQGQPNYFGNPAAFTQPCQLGVNGPIVGSPAGCVPLTGNAIIGGGLNSTFGPGFHRLDYSLFKDYHFSERYFLQFRAEMFNILNHPNFNAPGFGGNGVIAVSNSTNFTSTNFGEIGSTRDQPYDPRQIQFALKMYF